MASSYRIERSDHNCKVSVSGALTAILVPELKEGIKKELVQETREIVFDLLETTMLDSSGIGLLIATSNSVSATSASMRVINVCPEIFDVLSNVRLVHRLNIRPAVGQR